MAAGPEPADAGAGAGAGVPVFVTAYNNLCYVRNMVRQLAERGWLGRAVVYDNASTDPALLAYYEGCGARVVRGARNEGHNWWKAHPELLPAAFVLTDPDLELNPAMPADALEVLLELARHHRASRVGLALDLSDAELFYRVRAGPRRLPYEEIERPYWATRVKHSRLELYAAPIDTTFALHWREGEPGRQIRVAGAFTCKHLPWYEPVLFRQRYGRDIVAPGDAEMRHYMRSNVSSTMLRNARASSVEVVVNGEPALVRAHPYWERPGPWALAVPEDAACVYVFGCARLHAPIAALRAMRARPGPPRARVVCFDEDARLLTEVDFFARFDCCVDLLATHTDRAAALAALAAETDRCVVVAGPAERERLGAREFEFLELAP